MFHYIFCMFLSFLLHCSFGSSFPHVTSSRLHMFQIFQSSMQCSASAFDMLMFRCATKWNDAEQSSVSMSTACCRSWLNLKQTRLCEPIQPGISITYIITCTTDNCMFITTLKERNVFSM